MRIIIFSTAYLPMVGGAEIAVKEITDRIEGLSADEAGYQFDLITSRFSKKNPKKEKIGNIIVYRLGFGTKFDKYFLPVLGFFKAKKLLRENQYSLIWSVNASQAGLAALFLKLKDSKLPLLLTLQEGSSEQRIFRRRFMVWPLFKLIFKKADYIQAISKHLANFGQKMGAHCQIKVVPNGVDVAIFEKALTMPDEDKEALRKKLGIKENEKVIITVSRLAPKNAVNDLIDAVNMLKLQGINFKLLILGTGYLEKRLRLQVVSSKLQDDVLFLGLISPAEVHRYLAISDVFVRPSISEGLGNVFLEAMAAGVPVIGTPVGGIPDFLTHEKTGIFCESRNPKSIAEKIKILIKDQKLRDKLIQNAKQMVIENYNWDKISQEMKKIYEKIII